MTSKPVVLLCGGAGYIGSHCAIALCSTGRYKVILIDNLENSSKAAAEKVVHMCKGDAVFYQYDCITDLDKLSALKFDAVLHLAALKAVGESVEIPLTYYRKNLNSLMTILTAAQKVGCKNVLFSSSSTVYQPQEGLLLEDKSAVGGSNPYGRTKVASEQILKDLFISDPTWRIANLRYFNPIGAHESGELGESPKKLLNILPIVQSVAAGKLPKVNVFGSDWPTRDGTCIRDYIHVMDVAEGHVAAIDYLFKAPKPFCDAWNLGTGVGFSVLEVIKTFEKVSGQKVPYEMTGRRAGDLGCVVCDPHKAEQDLGWKVKRTLEDACSSAWLWQQKFPDGLHD